MIHIQIPQKTWIAISINGKYDRAMTSLNYELYHDLEPLNKDSDIAEIKALMKQYETNLKLLNEEKENELFNYRKNFYKSINVPASWGEMSAKQIRATIKLIAQYILPKGDFVTMEDYNAFYVRYVKMILNLSNRQFHSLSAEQVESMRVIADFIFGECTINTVPFASIRIGFTRYYSPMVGLGGSTMMEMIFADTSFINWSKSKSDEDLYTLMAVLYRQKRKNLTEWQSDPEKWNGDIREAFNENSVESRAAYFQRKIKKVDALAVAYFYWGFRNVHLLRFKAVFPQEVQTSIKKKGWLDTVLEYSGDKFGDFKSTSETDWQLVLLEIQRVIVKSKSN
jgi:hypothetical protein